MLLTCPKCGYENRDGAGFRCGCGQPFIPGKTYQQCGHANPQGNKFCSKCGHSLVEPAHETAPFSPEPTSFASGRHQVKEFLGEGGNRKVYPVHDTILDCEAASALIRTEKLRDAPQINKGHLQKPILLTRYSRRSGRSRHA